MNKEKTTKEARMRNDVKKKLKIVENGKKKKGRIGGEKE